jgi:hypothetical protein
MMAPLAQMVDAARQMNLDPIASIRDALSPAALRSVSFGR